MTPQKFAKKWKASTLKESSASQEHFIDLCRLIGEQTPAEADPDGSWYCFERGAKKTGGGEGWAEQKTQFGGCLRSLQPAAWRFCIGLTARPPIP